jgi:hypothetical protein
MQDLILEPVCRICGQSQKIEVRERDYIEWKNKKGLIQDVLWYLDDDAINIILHRTCGTCFDRMYGDN